ncbi:MAG TPA: ABC transporter permease [Candidatus Pelethosoma merdigallinarum]|nr:ABC transporter permease [Candidatus Pelethosoma merdigallinarum]
MNNKKIWRYFFLIPVIVYVALLIALPLLYILLISFFKSDSYGGMITTFTIQNYIEVFDQVYINVFLKSILIAGLTTFICILISYPFVLAVSHKKPRTQKILMTLVMVPFLTNSLIRMYGWLVLLRKSGVINQVLLGTGVIHESLSLMYNMSGILIGMTYTLLPFMILPLYSSVSTIDPSLLEAASDLGASKIKIFFKIIVPQTLPGLFNGSLMVFTPALGYFFIVDILGGGKIMILGNLIKNQFLTARNWPFGAAISIVLVLITSLLILAYRKLGGKMDDLGGA